MAEVILVVVPGPLGRQLVMCGVDDDVASRQACIHNPPRWVSPGPALMARGDRGAAEGERQRGTVVGVAGEVDCDRVKWPFAQGDRAVGLCRGFAEAEERVALVGYGGGVGVEVLRTCGGASGALRAVNPTSAWSALRMPKVIRRGRSRQGCRGG